MKVIASRRGYFGRLIEAGEVFIVPDGMQASWFTPHAEDVPEPDQEPPVASTRGRKKANAPVGDPP